MAKKGDTGRKPRKPKEALSRRDFFRSGTAAGISAAVLSSPGEAGRAGHRVELRGRRRHPRIGLRRAPRRGAGARPRGVRHRPRAELRCRRQARAQRRLDLARRRRSDPGARPHGGRSRWPRAAAAPRQGGRPRGRPRPPVQGHDGLVGRRCDGRRAVSLQRPRAPSRLGRQCAEDPAIHDGQLRPLRTDRRHPSGRRRHRAREPPGR